jgi:hypothetical protein
MRRARLPQSSSQLPQPLRQGTFVQFCSTWSFTYQRRLLEFGGNAHGTVQHVVDSKKHTTPSV